MTVFNVLSAKKLNAETLKQRRPIGERNQELEKKVSSRRINLECNIYVHGSNARNRPE
jgi:hypothetical protein